MSDIYELAKIDPKLFKEVYRESIARDPVSTDELAFANSKLNPDDLISWHEKYGFISSSASKKNGIHFDLPDHLEDTHLYFWENIYSDCELQKIKDKKGYKVFFNIRDDWEILRPYFENQQLEFRDILSKTIENNGQMPHHDDFDYRSGDPIIRINEGGSLIPTLKLFHYIYLHHWLFSKALNLVGRHGHLKKCSYCSAFYYLKTKSKKSDDRSYCSDQCASDYGNGKKPKLCYLD